MESGVKGQRSPFTPGPHIDQSGLCLSVSALQKQRRTQMCHAPAMLQSTEVLGADPLLIRTESTPWEKGLNWLISYKRL